MIRVGNELEINGRSVAGTLMLDIEYIDVTSFGATKPDMTWGVYDSNGHFHAWSFDDVMAHTLPTLKQYRRMKLFEGGDPDDPEAYYHDTLWRCRLCKEFVVPGRVPDPGPKKIPGMQRWSVVVTGPYPAGIPEDVSVRVPAGERVMFGIARPVSLNAGPFGTDVELIGIGPLGRCQRIV